eukprot:7547254-Alexandrium_andersonii.AAC.1
MSASLVGSEMCIRDSRCPGHTGLGYEQHELNARLRHGPSPPAQAHAGTVSYTHLTLPTICSV